MLNNQEIQAPVLIQDLGIMPISIGSKHIKRFGLYRCMCSKEFITVSAGIKSGNTKSCGCHKVNILAKRNVTHNMSKHKLYPTWKGMIDRCNNNKNSKFKYYGGRGITVCDRWKDVSLFIEDMYPSYQEGLSIDRINNDGNYEPFNCRWSTREVQGRNTSVLYSHNTSGFRGVHFNTLSKKWISKIKLSGVQITIGRYCTVIDAAKAYNKYVIDNNLEHSLNII